MIREYILWNKNQDPLKNVLTTLINKYKGLSQSAEIKKW